MNQVASRLINNLVDREGLVCIIFGIETKTVVEELFPKEDHLQKEKMRVLSLFIMILISYSEGYVLTPNYDLEMDGKVSKYSTSNVFFNPIIFIKCHKLEKMGPGSGFQGA